MKQKQRKCKRKKKTFLPGILVLVILGFAAGGYQVYRYPATFRHLSNDSLGEAEVQKLRETILEKESPRVLVAYFSYSGTTRGIAEALSEKTGANLFEISPLAEYSNVYTQSNAEIRRGELPELAEKLEDVVQYDIVFVGYPVWWHSTPAPVSSFLESHDLAGKLIIPFCTSGGSEIDETLPTFLDSCSGLAVYGGRRISGSGQLDGWLEELGLVSLLAGR